MDQYIDLSSVIDVEPEIGDILDLIKDENIVYEVAKHRSVDVIQDIIDSLSDEDRDALFEYIREDFNNWLNDNNKD